MHENGKWRAVIGWNHTNDTSEGREEGAIWCWVSAPPEKLQIFDQDFNRSKIPGERRDCGVANFTMIRMFHPYWTDYGHIPRDGVIEDKRCCRSKYHNLIHKHRIALGLRIDEDPEEHAERIAREKKQQREKRRAQATLRRDDRAPSDAQAQQRLENNIPGTLEVVPGGSMQDPMFISQGKDQVDNTAYVWHRVEGEPKDESKDELRDSGTEDCPLEVD